MCSPVFHPRKLGLPQMISPHWSHSWRIVPCKSCARAVSILRRVVVGPRAQVWCMGTLSRGERSRHCPLAHPILVLWNEILSHPRNRLAKAILGSTVALKGIMNFTLRFIYTLVFKIMCPATVRPMPKQEGIQHVQHIRHTLQTSPQCYEMTNREFWHNWARLLEGPVLALMDLISDWVVTTGMLCIRNRTSVLARVKFPLPDGSVNELTFSTSVEVTTGQYWNLPCSRLGERVLIYHSIFESLTNLWPAQELIRPAAGFFSNWIRWFLPKLGHHANGLSPYSVEWKTQIEMFAAQDGNAPARPFDSEWAPESRAI